MGNRRISVGVGENKVGRRKLGLGDVVKGNILRAGGHRAQPDAEDLIAVNVEIAEIEVGERFDRPDLGQVDFFVGVDRLEVIDQVLHDALRSRS